MFFLSRNLASWGKTLGFRKMLTTVLPYAKQAKQGTPKPAAQKEIKSKPNDVSLPKPQAEQLKETETKNSTAKDITEGSTAKISWSQNLDVEIPACANQNIDCTKFAPPGRQQPAEDELRQQVKKNANGNSKHANGNDST